MFPRPSPQFPTVQPNPKHILLIPTLHKQRRAVNYRIAGNRDHINMLIRSVRARELLWASRFRRARQLGGWRHWRSASEPGSFRVMVDSVDGTGKLSLIHI
eukprot:8731645-Pyramimonas_sp.AAC.1